MRTNSALLAGLSVASVLVAAGAFAAAPSRDLVTAKNHPGSVHAAGPYHRAPAPEALLHDNGPINGDNGYFVDCNPGGPIGTGHALDDFIVPAGQVWQVNDFHYNHVLNVVGATVLGIQLQILADNSNTPGAVLSTPTVTSFSDVPTGNVLFGRPEAVATANFSSVNLNPGHYWVRWCTATSTSVDYPLTSNVQNTESWVDYPLFGYNGTSNGFFGGGPEDFAMAITGTIGGGGAAPAVSDFGLALMALLFGITAVTFIRRRGLALPLA